MIKHFGFDCEGFIELDEGVDCSLPTNHTNGALAIDGLPLDEEHRREAQIDVSALKKHLKSAQVNCYIIFSELEHLAANKLR